MEEQHLQNENFTFKNEGKNGAALGDSPGGITGPAQLWECVDLIIGQDNQDRRPENTLGWPEKRDRREVIQ